MRAFPFQLQKKADLENELQKKADLENEKKNYGLAYYHLDLR